MAFMMTVPRFEKKSLSPKILSSFALLAQPHQNIANIGVIRKLLIQTRGPIPTYILLNPVSLLWSWHFKHGVYATSFPFP